MKKLITYGFAVLGTIIGFAAMALPTMAQRGSDGHLRIIYWQAPSTLNPYLSGGIKEIESSSLVIEPLARYDQDGNLIPYLARSIPTIANGGVSSDLRTITWKLKRGLRWSDGTPVTSEDIKFTWEYCTHPESGCSQTDAYNDVVYVYTPDRHTAVVVFGVAKSFPTVHLLVHNRPSFRRPSLKTV